MQSLLGEALSAPTETGMGGFTQPSAATACIQLSPHTSHNKRPPRFSSKQRRTLVGTTPVHTSSIMRVESAETFSIFMGSQALGPAEISKFLCTYHINTLEGRTARKSTMQHFLYIAPHGCSYAHPGTLVKVVMLQLCWGLSSHEGFGVITILFV